ncbi:hypothetical protein COCSADRAFT_327360 [Bipolaris sorokiniana ND90Pr]|uniref:Uncharacterized protein n=1 Tax=Cochliobolus sativus (strain ND90Pr / ATCC 201652) TaxID=665912 RepID=M2S803_COCSN|nr:uncharacterized protein COCSADRAFT_327360 [Bipolaris sorokiniana ND90Pr]EMD63403.1 hypothetical protein COCSADRAFT_327360 [Bipolaris sorokiniana ND90Pr]
MGWSRLACCTTNSTCASMYWQAIHLVLKYTSTYLRSHVHMQSTVYTWRLVTKSMPSLLPRLASWRARPLAKRFPIHTTYMRHLNLASLWTIRASLATTDTMDSVLFGPPGASSCRIRPWVRGGSQWPGVQHGATRPRSLPHSFSHGWWCGQIHFPCICKLSYAGQTPSSRGSLSSLANSIQPSSLRLEHRCRI